MVKIALDAGHGYNTPGKRTPDGEREWSFNNKVIAAAAKYLGGYENVQLLRLDDSTGKTDISLKARTDKANQWGADILISDHHNANTGRWGTWTGTETYVFNGPISKNTMKLAEAIHPRVQKAYGLRDRGIKRQNFHMLRESKMPAILIEGGYMDSTIDIVKLRDDKVLDAAGQAIAEGVAAYFGLKKKAAASKPPVAAKPTAPKKGLHKVQVGAYSVKKNADEMVRLLVKAGFAGAFVVQEGGFHKVQVGAYSEKKNADAIAERVKRAGFGNPYIKFV